MEDSDYFQIEQLDIKIKEKELKDYFKDKNLEILTITFTELSSTKKSAKITFNPSNFSLAIIEDLSDTCIPGYNDQLKFIIHSSFNCELLLKESIQRIKAEEGKEIYYRDQYHGHIKTDFIRNIGEDALIYINDTVLNKQRGIIGYFLKKFGTNILSGQSIMNISMPISIFDERSILELFAHRNILLPYFLEKAGKETNHLEKLKLTSTYAYTLFHLNVTQLKPFNPIWGETFQCKIDQTEVYIEQTSHHPPRYHFLILGQNFKSYGYNELTASTTSHGVTAQYLGKHIVEYADGTKYRIFTPAAVVGGVVMGNRTYNFTGKLCVSDEKNDYVTVMDINPDERGFFSKIVGKKSTFPDYVKGMITRKSQCNFSEKEFYTPKDKSFVFSRIEGEWSDFLKFDEVVYWDYSTYPHYNLQRKANSFILPSDSLFREDTLVLKSGNELEAQKSKVKLEELQRRDRKLRAAFKDKKTIE